MICRVCTKSPTVLKNIFIIAGLVAVPNTTVSVIFQVQRDRFVAGLEEKTNQNRNQANYMLMHDIDLPAD
jgi:hypothetical protein